MVTHRRLKIFAVLLLLCGFAVAAFGATYTVPALTGASIQATANAAAAAGPNNTVYLPAGIYNVASSISLPCGSGLTVTGPSVANWAQGLALLNATFSGGNIFTGYSCNGLTIQNLWFQNSGAIYLGATNHSNITITNNTFTGLPSTSTGIAEGIGGAVWLDGTINTTVTNFTVKYNTFGDIPGTTPTSCIAVNAVAYDYGGNCIGIHAQAGISINFDIEYNIFDDTEEGIHMANLLGSGAPRGSNQSVAQNTVIKHNYFLNWHRIGIELQMGLQGTAPGQSVSDNLMINPQVPNFGTMFISDACCTGGRTYLTSSPPNPANVTNDNVFWTTRPGQNGSFWAPVIGIEYWGGAGSTADYNVIGGYFSNYINWGFGVQPWYIQGNYLCDAYNGEYITDEEGSVTPVGYDGTGNTISTTCAQQTSTASTISPASGAYTSPPTITLTNTGSNTSSYYTTDGSTPTPGSGTTKLYTGPFQITLPTTIKTVGMWGVPPQPPVHQAPWGYQPSAVATATYTSTGGLALTSVTLTSASGSHALNVGQTLQLMATCGYSNGSTTNCSTTDVNGNAVSNWSSDNTFALTISGTGLATAVANGTANITATVNPGGLTSGPYAIAVSTPTISLNSVTLATTGGISILVAGGQNQLNATCAYSDGSSDNCNTADIHGNDAAFTSTAATVATVSASGLVTAQAAGSTNLQASVMFGATQATAGQQSEGTTGNTFPNFINATYVVFGNQMGGYASTGGTCSFYLPAQTVAAGSSWDCGLVPAPTPTTQGSSWQCWGTYTSTSTTIAGGWITVPLNSCGTSNLAAGSTWWVSVVTNQPGQSNQGFYNCGGSCNGSAPTTAGTGTYPCAFVADSYGQRTGMNTSMTLGCGPANTQASQYVTLGQPAILSNVVPLTVTAAAPTLVSAALTASGSPTTITVGSTIQFAAKCTYSNAQVTDCTVADIYGNAVTQWASSDVTKVSISTTGLAIGVAPGAVTLTANIGGLTSSAYNLTANAVAVTLSAISLAFTNGITGLFVGNTNQLIATCLYSDGSTTNCTTTDSHGNVASGWTSSNTAAATVSGTGLVTGVAPGTSNFTASSGSHAAPAIGLTVLAVPSGVYTITISGPVAFSGTVEF